MSRTNLIALNKFCISWVTFIILSHLRSNFTVLSNFHTSAILFRVWFAHWLEIESLTKFINASNAKYCTQHELLIAHFRDCIRLELVMLHFLFYHLSVLNFRYIKSYQVRFWNLINFCKRSIAFTDIVWYINLIFVAFQFTKRYSSFCR